MSDDSSLVVWFLSWGQSSAHLHSSRTGLRSPSLRCLLGILLCVTSCNSLWDPFQGPNPLNCVVTPGSCPEGLVCNAQTRLCEEHSLSLLAGALGGPGSADDTGSLARLRKTPLNSASELLFLRRGHARPPSSVNSAFSALRQDGWDRCPFPCSAVPASCGPFLPSQRLWYALAW